MEFYNDYEMRLELGHVRHAELLAEAEKMRMLRQLRAQRPQSWWQRAAASLSTLNRRIPALRVDLRKERITVADEPNSAVHVGWD